MIGKKNSPSPKRLPIDDDPGKSTFNENRRLIPDASFYAGHKESRNPHLEPHSLEGPYLNHQKELVAKFRDSGVEFDEEGIPWNHFRWGGPYRYSVTIGHHGLSCLARFVVDGDRGELDKALGVAGWLVKNQDDRGAWPIKFDHDWFPSRCAIIQAPWTSAMGQGLCISLLSRILALSRAGKIEVSEADSAAFEKGADWATRPFEILVKHGGVRARLFDRFVFFEEYPTSPLSAVLNGFIYCLLGLHDLWRLNGHSTAGTLYKTGVATLEDCLPFYDLGRGTAYDLTHVTTKSYPANIARPSYHFLHIRLLSVLSELEEGKFDSIVERWEYYLRGWGNRTN